jgi:hypothetical protein
MITTYCWKIKRLAIKRFRKNLIYTNECFKQQIHSSMRKPRKAMYTNELTRHRLARKWRGVKLFSIA